MDRLRVRAALLAGVAALAVGCGTATAPGPPPPPATVPVPAPAPTAPPTPAAEFRPVDVLPASAPVALAVPAIGARTEAFMDLGLDPAGALEVPPDARTAGWFTRSPAPGATGPSVIAGHVDYAGVPGVFVRLHELGAGDEIAVRRADGTEAVFEAYRVQRYPKSAFPTEQVYGDTDGPELRLITCGGVFDRSTGDYLDNVVAYARLVGVR